MNQTQNSQTLNCRTSRILKEESTDIGKEATKSSTDKSEDASHIKNASHGDIPILQVSTSSGFAWAKRRKDDSLIRRSHCRSISRGHMFNPLELSTLNSRSNFDSRSQENKEFSGECTNSRGHEAREISKLAMLNQWNKFDRPDSFDASDEYHSQELSMALYQKEYSASKRSNLVSLLVENQCDSDLVFETRCYLLRNRTHIPICG